MSYRTAGLLFDGQTIWVPFLWVRLTRAVGVCSISSATPGNGWLTTPAREYRDAAPVFCGLSVEDRGTARPTYCESLTAKPSPDRQVL